MTLESTERRLVDAYGESTIPREHNLVANWAAAFFTFFRLAPAHPDVPDPSDPLAALGGGAGGAARASFVPAV
eukprot:842655-Prorocentrum_minimum.AAC.9